MVKMIIWNSKTNKNNDHISLIPLTGGFLHVHFCPPPLGLGYTSFKSLTASRSALKSLELKMFKNLAF